MEPHSVYQAAPRFGGLVLPPLSPSPPLVLTHELRTTTGPPPPPPPSLCFPSVRPLCAFTLRPSVVALCPAACSQLQSHIDVPPGDTSTHRSPPISNGFVLIGRESGEKGAQSQSQSQSQFQPQSQSGENMSATNIGHQGLKPLQQNNSQTPGLQGGFFFKLSCATEYQHSRALKPKEIKSQGR